MSIKNQTYQNVETIFVDDGSTDNTGKLLDDFARTHQKSKVIHKANGESSTARNAGISIASGEYITFMDADDIIHPSTLDVLHRMIKENNADVAMYNFKRVPQNFSYPAKFNSIKNVKTEIHEGFDDVYASFLSIPTERSVCMKLFPTKILKKMDAYPNIFDDKCLYGEDVFFLSKYFKLCNKSVRTKTKLYYYRKVNNSKMHSGFKETDLTVFMYGDVFNSLDKKIYSESIKYVPSVICFGAMDLISKLSHSDYHNQKVVYEVYRRYRDNLKYLPRLSRLPLAYRFGTLFTLPIMYLMVRKKLKG
ncbi:MAG: glycosyltransferase [Bacilli bacterium]|nr:glycosyltransferase [Bacilli bacterium]